MQSEQPPHADLAGALRQLQEQLAVCVTLLEEAALYLVAYTPQQELPGHMLHGRHLHQDILAVVEAYRHDDCQAPKPGDSPYTHDPAALWGEEKLMSERPPYADLKVSAYEIGLCRLVGRVIEDVWGYVSTETGEPTFKLTKVVFTDGTCFGIEGEHDFPYLVTHGKKIPPYFDEQTLQQVHEESREDRVWTPRP